MASASSFYDAHLLWSIWVILIVGIKKRQKSKYFYTLGVLIKTEHKILDHSFLVDGGFKQLYHMERTLGVIQLFEPITTRWGNITVVYKNMNLITIICDANEPASCNNSNKCPHRFKCYTAKIGEKKQFFDWRINQYQARALRDNTDMVRVSR